MDHWANLLGIECNDSNELTNQGKPRAGNGLRARARNISRSHHRICFKFGGPLEQLQRSCGPKIEVFAWLDVEIVDALDDLCRLDLKRERER